MGKFAVEIKWAFIFIGMMLSWMVLEKLAGLHSTHIDKHAMLSNFVAIPAVAVYVFALLDKRKRDFAGKMTYMQGFMSGLVITGIVTLFSPLTQWITSAVITPEYFPNVIAYAVSSGQQTQAEAEAFFNLKNYLIQTVIFTPVMGLMTTAIVAVFTRKG